MLKVKPRDLRWKQLWTVLRTPSSCGLNQIQIRSTRPCGHPTHRMWLKLGQEIGKKLHETANLRLYLSGVMTFWTLFGDLRLTLNEFFNFFVNKNKNKNSLYGFGILYNYMWKRIYYIFLQKYIGTTELCLYGRSQSSLRL